MKKLLFLFLAVLCLSSCSGRHKAEKTAKAFLQAYRVDLDFNKARGLATERSLPFVAETEEMASMNPYARQEAPVLTFLSVTLDPDNKERAICTYTLNRVEKTLYLQKVEGKWKADLMQEALEQEAGMARLSEGTQGGFAAAASGPIVYKKRDLSKKK